MIGATGDTGCGFAVRSIAVTEPISAETLPQSTEPSALYTGYFSTVDEVIEHVRAADTLGLGFRLESYMVSSASEPDSAHVEFEFVLLGDMPARLEESD